MMGLLVIISQIFHQKHWAHLRPSVWLPTNFIGHIRDHQPYNGEDSCAHGGPDIPLAMLGAFETIGTKIVKNNGLTGDHWPNIPPAMLGPSEAIGNIPCEECWAHSKPSVRSLPNHTGSIRDHGQNIPAATLGAWETIGATTMENDGPTGDHGPNSLPATLGPSEAIGGISCEECWAHSKPLIH